MVVWGERVAGDTVNRMVAGVVMVSGEDNS